ncbi:SusC/RagA family TonB-linked outer membrane protein [Pedobacter psychrodurus]|uniref:SusC/RagA family TonB-linked outer membrane protein n=1 Tax=Pedobacter psychrodurus TaxID=2530456 RepID=UPI002931BEBB|nr:SusC/RagA family TonB-linked outer membrane protein [Pedobacter psychrodurus]
MQKKILTNWLMLRPTCTWRIAFLLFIALNYLNLDLAAFELNSFQVPIKGVVLDSKGLPIPGTTISVKGKKPIASTNAQGAFNINVEESEVLIFSSIGFKTKEVRISGQQSWRIILEEDFSQLEEVVSVGYGTQSKRLNATSTSSVKVELLQNRPSGSIESLLQGVVPGLLVQNNSGTPGGRSNIQIRGISNFALSANSNVVSTPLFIIDGVPQDQDAFNPSNPRQSITSVLAGINPYDLESVDVLKDASATAIYGSRGANGVIVITTKRGKIGKPIVSLNTQFGGSYYPELRKTLGGKAERDFKISLYNLYRGSKVGGGYSDMPIELSDSLNTYYNNNTDWQKLYFKDATLGSVNLSVSGANDNSSYRIGAGYYNESGTVIGSGFKSYSLTYNGIFNPTTALTITGRVNLSQTDASLKRGETFGSAVVGNNFSSSFRPGPSSEYNYAFIEAYRKGVNINLTRKVIATLEGSYDVTKFLNITSRGSATYTFNRSRSFNPSVTNTDGKSSASYSSGEVLDLLNENFVRLHHKFANAHTFDFVVGNSINVNKNDDIYGFGYGGPSDVQQVIQGYPQANITLVTNSITYGLLSYYGRLSYDYKQKYIFQGSLRADASSKFGKDNQWGNFGSLSAAWVFTEEGFFKKNIGDWFSFGKLRASYGKAGEQYQDNYLALGAYNSGPIRNSDGSYTTTNNTYNGVPLLAPNYDGGNGLPIPNLTWQVSTDYGAALETQFFKGRLSTLFEYYHKTKNGFLFEDPLASTSGYSKRFINSGAVRNTGIEATITAYITRPESKFQYNFTYMAATNKNILTKLPDFGRSITRTGFTAGNPYLEVGKPLNGFYLLKYLGVFASDGDVPINPYTGARLKPFGLGFASQEPYRAGDIYLYDANGDYIIQTRGDADKVYMGDPNPKFYGSFSHTFGYKFRNNSNISLSMQFNYSVGNKVYNQVLLDRLKSVSWTASNNLNYPGGQSNLLDVSDLDYWTPTNTDAKYPLLNPWRYYAESSYDFVGNYDSNTSLFLENGNFLRLNNITVGYDFSPTLLQKLKIRRLRVYAGLDNVFLLTNYSGVDPENVNSYGYDQGNGYPIAKKYNLGFNFEF